LQNLAGSNGYLSTDYNLDGVVNNSDKDNLWVPNVGDNVLTFDTKNCIVNMPKEKLVVLQGLDDYIVVDNDDILLVCRKTDEQNIRDIVNTVKLEKGDRFV